MYLIRAYSYDSTTAAVVTHLWSTGGFLTLPDDTPANAHWEARVEDPGNWEAHLFEPKKTKGRSEQTIGVIKLANPDGELDGLWNHGWGRPLEIWQGPDDAERMSDFTLLATHTSMGVDRVEGGNVIQIVFQDLQSILADKVINPTEFLGTNDGATGLEGTASDLKGKKRPVGYGQVNSAQAVQVNDQSLMFMVIDKHVQALTVTGTTDKGAALTYTGTPYANVAALQAATVPATNYAVSLGSATEAAYIKTGSIPAGVLTCNFYEGTAAADRTVAQIIKRILLGPCELTTADLDLASFTALDTACNWVVGRYVGTEEEKVGDVLDELCKSIGAFWTITAQGKVQVGLFQAPSGTEVLEVDEVELLDTDFEITVPGDFAQGIPPYKFTVEYDKHPYVFGQNDFAASVAASVKAQLTEEYRRTTPTVLAEVQTKHPNSTEYVHQTLLANSADAVSMQARLVSLYGTERELLVLPLPVSVAGKVMLNDCVKVTRSRFGWDSGALFRVIGRDHRYASGVVVLYCWR